MKITSTVLSIPPYISTTWNQIDSLSSEQGVLHISLKNGLSCSIPSLGETVLQQVFAAYEHYLEGSERPKESVARGLGFSMPIMNEGSLLGRDPIFNLMEHSPEFANAPLLPEELANKLKGVLKAIGVSKDRFPTPEPHCNCPCCQMARIVHEEDSSRDLNSEGVVEEVDVSEGDLAFSEWIIKDLDNNLFDVSSPDEEGVSYRVFLGNPMGCTCGKQNCEHIKAVLRS